MTQPRLLALLTLAYVGAIHLQSGVLSQVPPPKRPPEELLRLSLAAGKPGLAEPFKGITATGQIEAGLFTLRSTGVSTEPVRKAAEAFLAGLTHAQRARSSDTISGASATPERLKAAVR
jgi:hypothetical protein